MRKKGGEPVKERSIRLTPVKMDKADEVAKSNYMSFNGLVEMLVDAAAEYYDTEGELPTPIAIVPKREMEVFRKWQLKNVESDCSQAEETA